MPRYRLQITNALEGETLLVRHYEASDSLHVVEQWQGDTGIAEGDIFAVNGEDHGLILRIEKMPTLSPER